jgi:hypothetical protein
VSAAWERTPPRIAGAVSEVLLIDPPCKRLRDNQLRVSRISPHLHPNPLKLQCNLPKLMWAAVEACCKASLRWKRERASEVGS